MKTESTCKWCSLTFNLHDKPKGWMANHSRWCDFNPKKAQYLSVSKSSAVKAMNESRILSGRLNQYSVAKIDGTESPIHPMSGKSGTFLGKRHTAESIEKIRSSALNSKHRRLKKNMIDYNGTMLDSSWELALAIRLDELNIKWIRPEPIEWEDDHNIKHNYFPDFYLIEYDLYLDPKNPMAYSVQKEKIEILKKQLPNLIIIETLKECKEFSIK